MNGRSPFSPDSHFVFLAPPVFAEELPPLPFFIFLGQRGGGGAFLRSDGLNAGGADVVVEELAGQKVHDLHLQNLQWLPLFACLQKAPHASNWKSPFRLEEQAFLGVVSSEAHAHASRDRTAAQTRCIAIPGGGRQAQSLRGCRVHNGCCNSAFRAQKMSIVKSRRHSAKIMLGLAGRGSSRLSRRCLSTKSPRDVCIVAAARTPIGGFGGSLASVPAVRLGATAITGVLKRVSLHRRRRPHTPA